MNKQRRKLITIGTLATIGLLSGGIAWRNFVLAKQEKQQIAVTQRLLGEQRAADALSIIWSHGGMPPTGERTGRWLEFEITALEQLKEVRYLLPLYDKHKTLFDNHEFASSLIARALLQSHDKEGYQGLLKHWEKTKRHPEYWLEVEVDKKIVMGERNSAIEQLKSTEFKGERDCGRLLRLATMYANSDLKTAWGYLQQAYRLNPKHPDVRLFRGQVLERMGKPEWARVEYVAAFVASPKSPVTRNQLAQFYIRYGSYENALQTWQDGLTPPSLDYIWLKSQFWGKLFRPVDFSKAGRCPSGDLEPLVAYLQGLPEGVFWDDAGFEQLTDAPRYQKQTQEVFWLRLLHSLKVGKEEQALALLQQNTFRKFSFEPYLERALVQTLTFRKSGRLPSDVAGLNGLEYDAEKRHSFLMELEKSAGKPISPELARFLKSPNIFSALCFAVGWREAGLTLAENRETPVPSHTPDWYAYAVTQSLRANRSTEVALVYAKRQHASSALRLTVAEMQLAGVQKAEGMAELAKLAPEASEVGYRASWILALLFLEQNRLSEAERLIVAQPRLSADTTGVEILARIALAKGDKSKSQRLYERIANTSMEAKASLARSAFQQKDFNRAEQLTEELVQQYPDEMQLRENLNAIRKAKRTL